MCKLSVVEYIFMTHFFSLVSCSMRVSLEGYVNDESAS
jgi:hypothetical protein